MAAEVGWASVDLSAAVRPVASHGTQGRWEVERHVRSHHRGFSTGYWLRALQGDVLRSVQIFDTEANALATAERIRSEGPAPGSPVTLTSVDTYEVIADV